MDANEAVKVFGIAGGFANDEDLLEEIVSCGETFLVGSSKPPIGRLVSLLGSLPLKGRYAFVRKYLGQSQHRDAILRELFDYCFSDKDTNEDDDGDTVMSLVDVDGNDEDTVGDLADDFNDFVLIGNPMTTMVSDGDGGKEESDGGGAKPSGLTAPLPLNLKKFHIFQVVVVLMALSGPAGAEASRRYLTSSSSTKYRGKILVQIIECFSRDEFSDDELLGQYQISPRSIQDKIVETLKHAKKNRIRQDLLRRVYEQDTTRHPDLCFFLDKAYVASHLEDLFFSKNPKQYSLEHWGSHGDAYLEWLRRKMDETRPDKLKQGTVWNDFVRRLHLHSVQSRHLEEIIRIWEEHQPSYITSSTPSDARKFLESSSARGEDVRLFTNEVRRYDLDNKILVRLSKKEKLNLAKKYLQLRNWDNFDMIQRHSSAVHRHNLPYKEFFASVGVDDVWTDKAWDPFLTYFWRGEIYSCAQDGQQKMEVFQAWSSMLMKVQPSMSDLAKPCGEHQGKDLAGRWRWWYKNYCCYFPVMEFFNGSAESSSSYEEEAAFAKLVLEFAMQAYKEVSNILPPEEAVEPVLQLLNRIPYERCTNSGVAGAQAVANECVDILTKTVMPIYSQAIQFNPSDTKTYVNRKSIGEFGTRMTTILKHWGSSAQVVEIVATTVLDLYSRASKADGERLVVTDDATQDESPPAPKRRKRFVYFDHGLHSLALQKCQSLCRTLCWKLTKNAKPPVKIDKKIEEQLWSLVKNENTSAGTEGPYLDACIKHLPERLREGEKATIIKKSRAAILSKFKSVPHRWKEQVASIAKQLVELLLLETVLEDEDVPKKVRDTLLVDHAGFANETVRQSLKDATYVADGESRAEGLTNWLSEACKTGDFRLIVEALQFAEGRVKNEAGPNRKTIFAWFESHFVNDFVLRSLKAESPDLDMIQTICSSIVSILRNDLSRLDCVGGMVCFSRLPKLIINQVLAFAPEKQLLEIRRLWIQCSIRLHWELQAAKNGIESLACYSWPLNSHDWSEWRGWGKIELKSACWITEEAFTSVYPPSDATNKQVKKPNHVSGFVRKGFDTKNCFGPAQCVDTLVTALREVWSDNLPVTPLLQDGSCFPEEEEVANALRLRMEYLFCLCGANWQEVDLLKQIFDNIFKNLKEAPDEHFTQACQFLKTLWDLHGERGFVEVQETANACNEIFKRAVASNMREVVEEWLPRWKAVYVGRGRRKWNMDVDNRTKNFVYEHCVGCEPKAWSLAMTKTDEVQRQCSLSRELLDMSSSALMLDLVRKTLFERRQDILVRYLADGCDLKGVFNFDNGTQPESVDEVLFDSLQEQQLLGCPASVSLRYAQYSLSKATSNRCDLRSRISAIGDFMSSPSTQPADVLAALQSDLEEAVRESLINRVFSLDSPWHILGFLLSQKAIEKNDQRITSALLGYVARHVPLDKVVLVVGHLLKKSRRKKLGFQLHKAAIRMLFDADTDVAMGFLRKEWDYDLHESIRTVLIQKCLEKVLSGRVDGWEASVLLDVAGKESVDIDLKFCLFAPAWQGIQHQEFGSLVIKPPEDVLADDTFDLFRKKDLSKVSFTSSSVAAFLFSVMEKLESSSEGSLQLLARIKKLSFSNLFGGGNKTLPAHDDQGSLEEMMNVITKPVDFADHKTQVERHLVSQMFACASIKLIKQQMTFRYRIPKKEVEEQFNKMEITEKLRVAVRKQLDAALDLPIRKHLQRAVHLDSLEQLLSTVNNFVLNDNEFALARDSSPHRLLVIDPFKKELDILKKDENHVRSVFAAGHYQSDW